MSVVVVQTSVQCILGIVDDEGNVVQKTPVNLEVPKLDKELFVAAFDHLVKAKGDLAKNAAPGEFVPDDEPKRKGAK